MKKIASILLVLVILLSFSGCKKEELNEDNIVDTWKAEISVENFSLITGMKIAGNGTELPSEYIKKINSFELPLYIIFNENGKCDKKVLKADIDKLYEHMLNVVMDFFENQGLLLKYQAEGAKVNSNEQLKEYFISNSTTFEKVLAEFKETFKKIIKDEKAKYGFLKADKNGFYTITQKPEKYIVSETSITFINEKEIATFSELTDKNTILITKVFDGEKEHNVSITFKRTK
ncbi:MAG: hypothetical protein IJA44_04590 [Clostridia bacterium]|nr:hypothetical protein [Clostridia bacterium]